MINTILSNVYTQYFAVFIIISILNNIFSFFQCIVNIIVWTTILITIAFSFTKLIQKYLIKPKFINCAQKAVLITGCDSGFGNRLAFKLYEIGFMVYATVLDADSGGAKQIKADAKHTDKLRIIQMNVKVDDDVRTALDEVSRHLESSGHRLWAVVNNAGIASFCAVDWGTVRSFANVFEVNAFGAVRVTRHFLPLIRRSKGRVVNVSSILGRYTGTECAPYSMSKHAIISFSDALRREMRAFGVKVSTVEPGVFKTPITSETNSRQFLETEWNQTDESVQRVYGREHFESVKRKMLDASERYGCRNIDLVVDAIIDAIRNEWPRIRYTVIDDWATTIFMVLVEWLPIEFMDYIVLRVKK